MVHGEIWTVKELFVTPNEYIYWSIQIVMYPFMTGLVAGAFVLSSLYHVFGIKELKEIARFALVFSLALLPVAMMPLQLHLQQPRAGNRGFSDASLHLGHRRLWYCVQHLRRYCRFRDLVCL